MTPQERDIQIRQALAVDRRERDALLRRDRQAENIAVGLDVLCKILSAANAVFEEDISLSMLPGESVDGTPASATLHCVEIEYLGWYTWRVRSRLFQYDAYVKDWDGNQHFTPFTPRTTQGSCSQVCQCGYCQTLRRATVQVRRPQHVE